ncbi:Rrf2 family transcriptional regulator [Synechococcus sp. CBW1004]|uniref:RrF2 family transcriptional regulator n=1 Tax=Synechococcus sp. CBW1004 TaxID=1353136 RepID=UPI0018CFBA75|nr:Rrf2 family transcriptional regulator [Synechococcus sp. CBW1004]QPN63227.1 Rrf2 family transcriptional regulator [Synechococcus sp. CBW1004]
MLSRAAAIALRALVELAREPALTLSVAELARRQQLPQPMLEQILLRLRRAGVVEARRGRQGGYRLAQQAEMLPLARVLEAVELPRARPQAHAGTPPLAPLRTAPLVSEEPGNSLGASAGHRVEQQLRRRLERLVQLELQRLTLAELLYDQRSWEASLGPEGGVMLS